MIHSKIGPEISLVALPRTIGADDGFMKFFHHRQSRSIGM